MSIFKKVMSGLTKTRENIVSGVENVLSVFTKIDEELFEELEDALIMADMGVETSTYIIDKLRERIKKERVTNGEEVKGILKEEIANILLSNHKELEIESPTVLLVIGVNGVGKTTSIGKMTHYYKEAGNKVLLAAADTFRAGAIEQLEVWAERNEVAMIKHAENADPSAVVFDSIQAAKARGTDVLIADTAGRLHNKKNLMEELKKINRIVQREYANAKIEVLLVLDANTGQNALVQAKAFSEVADITGIILTKLDSTAKGGIVVAIKNQLDIPIYFIGVGEAIDDLVPFDPTDFANSIFE